MRIPIWVIAVLIAVAGATMLSVYCHRVAGDHYERFYTLTAAVGDSSLHSLRGERRFTTVRHLGRSKWEFTIRIYASDEEQASREIRVVAVRRLFAQPTVRISYEPGQAVDKIVEEITGTLRDAGADVELTALCKKADAARPATTMPE